MFCQAPPSLSCQQYACALTPVNMCRCCSGACMPPFGHLSPSPRPYFAQAAPHRRPPSQAAPGQARGASGGQLWPRLGRACPLPAALLVQAPRQPQEPWLDVACDHIPAPPNALCLFAALFLPRRYYIRRDGWFGGAYIAHGRDARCRISCSIRRHRNHPAGAMVDANGCADRPPAHRRTPPR